MYITKRKELFVTRYLITRVAAGACAGLREFQLPRRAVLTRFLAADDKQLDLFVPCSLSQCKPVFISFPYLFLTVYISR